MSNLNGTPAPVPAPSRRWWLPWLGWLLAVIATAVASYLGYQTPVPPPPMDVPSQGWIENPDEVDRVVAGLQFKSFADTPAGQAADPLATHAYLWEAERRVTGSNPPSKNQNPVGSCVSFGTNTAIERTIAVEAASGKPFRVVRLVEEATYGGSRVEVGGGRIRGDGSVGAWAADWVRKWGVIERGKHGSHDLTRYDPQRCRDWGRNGVPDDLETVAREHSVQTTTLVKTWEDAKRALSQGYGIAICSSQGFAMRRDSNGVCRASGSWAHCMCLDGYHAEGDKEYGHIENSWGPDAHTGPVGWGDPPTSGFWAESRTIDRMLKQGDSWAFSAVNGFPARRIDWLVHVDPPRNSYARRGYRPCEPLFSLAP